MDSERPAYDDEPPFPQPGRFWVPRMLIAGVCVGLAAAAYVVYGIGGA